MTVAYVFWHRPRPDVDPAVYADALGAFHAALGAEPPRGLLASWALRLGSAPWDGGGEGWFEDWYVLRGLGALGALERAAIDARRRGTHDAAASGPGPAPPAFTASWAATRSPPRGLASASWLAKPDGQDYEHFLAELRDAAGPGASVWQRRLTLGPTPEFAVVGDRPARRSVAAPDVRPGDDRRAGGRRDRVRSAATRRNGGRRGRGSPSSPCARRATGATTQASCSAHARS